MRQFQVVAVLFALLFPSLLTWVYFVALRDSPAWMQQLAWAIGKTVQFAFPAVWVFVVLRQRPVLRRPTRTGLSFGVGFGLAVFVAMFAGYHLWMKPAAYLPGDTIVRKVQGFGIDGLASYALLGVFYSVVHSFLEEYYWRWFAYGQLRRLAPTQLAVIVSSLAFMAHHVIVLGIYFGLGSWMTWLFSLGVAAGGAVWAWLYQRSDSLYAPWISHLIVDAAIFVVGYDLVQPLFSP